MQKKIDSSIVAKSGRSLMVELQENQKNGVKKLNIFTVDEEGVCREIGSFTPYELKRGKCKQAIGNVFPELILSDAGEKECGEIIDDLKKIFINDTPVAESNTFSIKEVQEMTYEYIREHEKKDCLELDEDKGVCKLNYDFVDTVLKSKLNTGWERLEFGRMLKRQGILHEGNDRLAKKETLSVGKGQYRALEFDIEFKGVLCNE